MMLRLLQFLLFLYNLYVIAVVSLLVVFLVEGIVIFKFPFSSKVEVFLN